MKTVSIIGLGWLGEPLAIQLKKEGYTVKGSTTSYKKQSRLLREGIDVHILKADPIIDAVSPALFDTDVIVLNIPPGRKRENVVEYHRLQVTSILNCIPQKTPVVFLSSTGVYGRIDSELDEESPLSPMRESAKAILVAEQILQKSIHPICTLRLAGLAGGDREPGRFFAGKTAIPNGNSPVNFVHRKDVIAIVSKVIGLQFWPKTFNVCADLHPTRSSFYRHQAKKLGLVLPEFLADGINRQISNEKLKKAIDYKYLYPDPMLF